LPAIPVKKSFNKEESKITRSLKNWIWHKRYKTGSALILIDALLLEYLWERPFFLTFAVELEKRK
jgi:hypothetical protein